jgi:hypothetical protein
MICKHHMVPRIGFPPRKLLIAGTGCLLLLAGAGVLSRQAHAGLLGQTVRLDRLVPSVGFDYDKFVGQTGDVVAGVSGPLSLSLQDNLSVSVGNSTITYEFGPAGGGGIADDQITFAEAPLTITGISVLSTNFVNLTGFSPSELSFTSNSVDFFIDGLIYGGDNTVVVQLDFASVPEPAMLALFSMSLAGVGIIRRRGTT